MSRDDPQPRAGISPGEQGQWLEKQRQQRAEAVKQQQQLDEAMARVLGREGDRNADQRRVWQWLTKELFSICTKEESLAIFEGRRQKGVEAIVMIERAAKPSP